MSTAIKVENLSKAYQLGTIGTGTLSRDLERWIAKVRGKEDPFMRIGEANDRSVKGSSDVVLSLNNVSFDIQQGDAVGIIGRNGAGKSTLLKLLSRVTSPTTGTIKVKGRIASLLEVGTGFHPELTGRENIFLNGAILGMRKKEIRRKFDEIVDFAGVERYIDTPVKRYSSGMYVRLAFAVAAHLESEILIVDEVLAVGDAEFQKKCLGKMGDVSKGEGRTVLFVSHNMGSVAQLCKKGILLKNGTVFFNGESREAINLYAESSEKLSIYDNKVSSNFTSFKKIEFINGTNGKNTFLSDSNLQIKFLINITNKIPDLTLSVIIRDQSEKPISSLHKNVSNFQGMYTTTLTIPSNTIIPGNYFVEPVLHIPNIQNIDVLKSYLSFEIEDFGGSHSAYTNADLGSIIIPATWQD